MVDNASFTCRYEKNPYNFKHFNTSSIAVYVNGESLAAHAIKCDFDNNLNGGCNGGHQEVLKRGTIRISIEFAIALPNTVTIILYADFGNQVTIDKTRSVLKNY